MFIFEGKKGKSFSLGAWQGFGGAGPEHSIQLDLGRALSSSPSLLAPACIGFFEFKCWNLQLCLGGVRVWALPRGSGWDAAGSVLGTIWGLCPHTWTATAAPLLPSHSTAAMQGQSLMLRIWAFYNWKFSVYFLQGNLIPRTACKKNITHTDSSTHWSFCRARSGGDTGPLLPLDVGQANLPEQGHP